MSNLLKNNNKLLKFSDRLLLFKLIIIDYLSKCLPTGWSGNRMLDSKGERDQVALGGGYLYPTFNNTITISGLLTTDILVALSASPNNAVGIISANNTITLTDSVSYGAFEVYRGGVKIGCFCMINGIGTNIINKITGTIGNGTLNGTLTGIWQRSNKFYSDENVNGYSIAASTNWYANNNATGLLTENAIVPQDPINQTKCLAYNSLGVQYDLQNVGRVKYSAVAVPQSFYCNTDRYWKLQKIAVTGTVVSHIFDITFIVLNKNVFPLYCDAPQYVNWSIRINQKLNTILMLSTLSIVIPIPDDHVGRMIRIYYNLPKIQVYIDNILFYEKSDFYWTNSFLNSYYHVLGAFSNGASPINGYIGKVYEVCNGIVVRDLVPDQHSTSYLDLVNKTVIPITGVSTNLHQTIDLGWSHHSTGYAIYYNGTDYRIAPLATDGTSFDTYAGYTVIETILPNTPNIDARLSMYKYAVSNGYDMYSRYPQAFNADGTVKLLTYAELKDLPNQNAKIKIIEIDNKITEINFIK